MFIQIYTHTYRYRYRAKNWQYMEWCPICMHAGEFIPGVGFEIDFLHDLHCGFFLPNRSVEPDRRMVMDGPWRRWRANLAPRKGLQWPQWQMAKKLESCFMALLYIYIVVLLHFGPSNGDPLFQLQSKMQRTTPTVIRAPGLPLELFWHVFECLSLCRSGFIIVSML